MKRNALSHTAGAVITGAGSGIGRSFAQELCRRGSAVVCADINQAAADETVELLRSAGGQAFAVHCDVGKAEDVYRLANAADELLGRPVNLVINNAGVGLGGRVGEISLDDWDWCVKVNLWGVIHGCHYFVPRLRKAGGGGIINVASAAGFGAAPEMGPYNATKAAVMSLSETLAAELAQDNIHVNVLCPTFVPTNIISNSRLPAGRSTMAAKMMEKYAFTTSDAVAKLTLDNLDKGRLYTVPQVDAKVSWLLKRIMPGLYARGLGHLYERVV